MPKSKLILEKGEWHQAPNLKYDMRELRWHEKLIYGYFCRCAVDYAPEWPSYSQIKEYCDIGSNHTVSDGLKGLEEKRLLEILPQFGKGKNRKTNDYKVLVPSLKYGTKMKPVLDVLEKIPEDKIDAVVQFIQQLATDAKKPAPSPLTIPAPEASAGKPPASQPDAATSDNDELKTYGHKRNVYLTDKQYERLITDFGANVTADFIDQLDSRIGSDGGPDKCKYRGNYDTVRRWIKKALDERSNRTPWDKDESYTRLFGEAPTEPYPDKTLLPFDED